MPDCYPRYFAELYEASQGREVGLSFADFAEALLMASGRFLPAHATEREVRQFYHALHLSDLALAKACCQGLAEAWERFTGLYKDKLYPAALVIAKDDSIAREIADSLAGDVFESKLKSYSGRGSLEGWLKAVLANLYVDRYRSKRREVSLEERLASIGTACLSQPAAQYRTARYEGETMETRHLHQAIEAACSERNPEQRFLLAAYFFDGWSLAEIGKRLGVHESTISRRMDRLLRELRRNITVSLQERGMNPRQIENSLAADPSELLFDIRAVLLRGINLVRE